MAEIKPPHSISPSSLPPLSSPVVADPALYRLKQEKLRMLEAEAEHRQCLPHLHAHKFYRWQRDFLESRNRAIFLTAANQTGKAQCVNSLIDTPQGRKRFGDLRVGDEVFHSSGKPTRVVAIPYEGLRAGYRITLADGKQLTVSEEHLFKCKVGYSERFGSNSGWTLHTAKEIYTLGNYSEGISQTPVHRGVIPYTDPVEYPSRDSEYLIPPYLLGLLIGDGDLSGCTFTKPEPELHEAFGKVFTYALINIDKGSIRIAGLRSILRGLGLEGQRSWDKTIPAQYLYTSAKDRHALLQGLFDTDGSVYGNMNVEWGTTSPILADQVEWLIYSLGGSCKRSLKKTHYLKAGVRHPCKDYHRFKVKFPETLNPFRLKRKAAKFRAIRYQHERVIYKMEPIPYLLCRCITVDEEDGLYSSGDSFVVSHNSTINLVRNIEWATNPTIWPHLWASRPNQFWYLYPNRDTAHIEYETKWKLYLPRGRYKNHPRYGWQEELGDRKRIHALHFNSGVHLYFKTYSQDAIDLQAGTVYNVSTDEEMPYEIYPELGARLNATDGYFSMVFTATLGQQEWYDTMELQGQPEEKFPDAKKIQVSLYDCMQYEDGTPGPWTEERINRAISRCGTEAEIQRRVFGRFVFTEGRKYPAFNTKDAARPRAILSQIAALKQVPEHLWLHYVGIDYGSGGSTGHPSAITILAVHPNMDFARVVSCWRGDNQRTSAHDVVLKYEEMVNALRTPEGNRIPVVQTFYDWAAADLHTIATRRSLCLTKAEKGHEKGEATLNSLFKNKMLWLSSDDSEQMKLAQELSTLRQDTSKNKAKDDLIDSLRYAAVGVPWDWSRVGQSLILPNPKKVEEPKSDREWTEADKKYARERALEETSVSAEIDEWNDAYGTGDY